MKLNKIIFSLALFFIMNACVTAKHNISNSNKTDVLYRMQLVMGELPSLKGLPPFKTNITDSIAGKGYKRYRITFTVANNEILPALLYIPQLQNGKKRAAILALHSTDAAGKMVLSGTGKRPDRAYAIELAERGYVVLAPDYPGFGELSQYNFSNDRYESGTMKGIFNHIRCIDFLQSLPETDAERIGIIGHSLGGHNAIFTAAFDKRIKVTIASCGWTDFEYYNAGTAVTEKYGGKLGPWAQELYMPYIRSKYQLDPDKIPFNFHEVISHIAPRAFFTNSPLYDANFNIDGVKAGMAKVELAYKKLNASDYLRAYYPDAKHDFPKDIRLHAYEFMDSILRHSPNKADLH